MNTTSKIISGSIVLALIILGLVWYKKSALVDQEVNTSNFSIQTAVYNGLVNLHNQTFSFLTVNGTANLDNIITDELEVSGVAVITESSIKSAVIRGVLNARKSTFETIDITTTEMTLDGSQFNNLTVHPSAPLQQQKVILRNKSIINGDLTFDQTGGLVVLDSGSEVKGNIIGGSIQR